MAPDPSKELNDGFDLQVYSDGQGAVAIAVPDANDATILQFIEIFGDVNGGSIDWSANVSPASVYMSDMGGNYVLLDEATLGSAELDGGAGGGGGGGGGGRCGSPIHPKS